MSISSRTTRRVIVLGVAISLAFLGFSLSRPTSKAQEPAKTPDRKALREQILALHADIEFLEIVQGLNRQELSEAIKEERAILARVKQVSFQIKQLSFQKMVRNIDISIVESLEAWGQGLFFELSDTEVDDETLRKALSVENKEGEKEIGDKLGKEILDEFKALAKVDKKEEFAEGRKRLVNRVRERVLKNATEGVREKSGPLKVEFARRSTELAGKKLDLESLERQYREAR